MRQNKNEESLWELLETIKQNNLCVMRILEGEEGESGRKLKWLKISQSGERYEHPGT